MASKHYSFYMTSIALKNICQSIIESETFDYFRPSGNLSIGILRKYTILIIWQQNVQIFCIYFQDAKMSREKDRWPNKLQETSVSDSTFFQMLLHVDVDVISEFMGKTFQAAQLTHERFLTIDHSCNILVNIMIKNLSCVSCAA